jgi:hypothetical protein
MTPSRIAPVHDLAPTRIAPVHQLAPSQIAPVHRRLPCRPHGRSRHSALCPVQIPHVAASGRRRSPAVSRFPRRPARPRTRSSGLPRALPRHVGGGPFGYRAAPPPPSPTRPTRRQVPPVQLPSRPGSHAGVEPPPRLAPPLGSAPHQGSLHVAGPGHGLPSDWTLAQERFRRAPPGPAVRPASRRPEVRDGPIPLRLRHRRAPAVGHVPLRRTHRPSDRQAELAPPHHRHQPRGSRCPGPLGRQTRHRPQPQAPHR